MKFDIFASFNTEEAEIVENVFKKILEFFELKIYGLDIKRNKRKSSSKEVDYDAINNSKLFIAFISNNYLQNTENLNYLKYAISMGKRLLFVEIDEISYRDYEKFDLNENVIMFPIYKSRTYIEEGRRNVFIKFIEQLDKTLRIYKYNGPNNLRNFYDATDEDLNLTLKLLEKGKPAPVYHYKCRFDSNDKNCESNVYTRTTNIFVSQLN